MKECLHRVIQNIFVNVFHPVRICLGYFFLFAITVEFFPYKILNLFLNVGVIDELNLAIIDIDFHLFIFYANQNKWC